MAKPKYNGYKIAPDTLKEVAKLGYTPKINRILRFAEFLKRKYNISKKLEIELRKDVGAFNGGLYIDNKIIIYENIKLPTLLHELRHWIQFNTRISKELHTYELREIDARMWSSSIICKVNTEKYKKENYKFY